MEAKKVCVLGLFVVFAAVFGQCANAQTVHVVGGDMCWDTQDTGAAAYVTWAASKQFVVGDILLFNFTTNEHDVLEVPKASFDACTRANPIGSVITTGPANITLASPGQKYYICTIGSHCNQGQKLAITVSSVSGGASPPSTTPPAASGTPAGTGATTTPAASSANIVLAVFLLPIVSIAMTLFV